MVYVFCMSWWRGCQRTRVPTQAQANIAQELTRKRTNATTVSGNHLYFFGGFVGRRRVTTSQSWERVYSFTTYSIQFDPVPLFKIQKVIYKGKSNSSLLSFTSTQIKPFSTVIFCSNHKVFVNKKYMILIIYHHNPVN